MMEQENITLLTIARLLEGVMSKLDSLDEHGSLDRIFTPEVVARRYNIQLQTLAKRRLEGTGPGFVKIGKCVRYPEAGLLKYEKEQSVQCTN